MKRYGSFSPWKSNHDKWPNDTAVHLAWATLPRKQQPYAKITSVHFKKQAIFAFAYIYVICMLCKSQVVIFILLFYHSVFKTVFWVFDVFSLLLYNFHINFTKKAYCHVCLKQCYFQSFKLIHFKFTIHLLFKQKLASSVN